MTNSEQGETDPTLTHGSSKRHEAEHGEPRSHDPSFRGPLEHRSCTDIICMIVFLLFLLAYGILSVVALAWGNPALLLYPRDTQGNLCGYGAETNAPNLFFFDLTQCARVVNALSQGLSCPTPQICLQSCPDYYWSWIEAAAMETATGGFSSQQRSKMLCKYGINATSWKNMTISDLVTKGYCAPYVLPESAVAGRCLPSALVDGVQNLVSVLTAANMTLTTTSNNTVTAGLLSSGQQFVTDLMVAVEFVKRVFQDLASSWPHILVGSVLAALVSLLWLILLRFSVGIMVWLVLISFTALFGFASYYTLWRFLSLMLSGSNWSSGTITASWDYFQNQMWFWLLLCSLSCLFLLVVLVIVIFLRSRIEIAIALLRQTSSAVTYMMEVLLLPLIPFALHILLATYCVVIAAYIATLGMLPTDNSTPLTSQVYRNTTYSTTQTPMSTTRPTGTTQLQVPSALVSIDFNCAMINQYNVTILNKFSTYCTVFQSQIRSYVVFFELFNVFLFFWLFNWITGLFQMSTAGSFATYYFTRERPRDLPFCPMLTAFWRTIRYHLGTVAFGSLIIAIVQLIRFTLEYIKRNCAIENVFTKFVLKCCICCLYCLEKCLKFITKNAYIMCAIRGKNFCFSAKDAFFILMRNSLRVFVLDMVTDFVLFIGKVVVVAGIGTLAYFVFSGHFTALQSWIPQLYSFATPMVVLVIITFIVANVFFTVYEMGVDTIFLCFLEDLEMNDGSAEKPYFMNRELRRILHKRNAKAKQRASGASTPEDQEGESQQRDDGSNEHVNAKHN